MMTHEDVLLLIAAIKTAALAISVSVVAGAVLLARIFTIRR